MTHPADFYRLLGLARSATQEQIKKAYLKAAQRYHPDKNVAPGETELFIDVQQAYEVLSNPDKRAEYDKTLAEIAPKVRHLVHEIHYSRQSLLAVNEQQVVYAMLELRAEKDTNSLSNPLNICLVMDRSTSMKGEKMDVVKSTAIQLLRGLRDQDVFGVVSFSDRAEIIVRSGFKSMISKSEARIHMIQPSGGTELFQGLETGYNELRRYIEPSRVNHIILLTDGHTYGDEEQCLELARQAAEDGVGISALGIGTDWNDAFLDELARITGGSSFYIANPQDIQRLMMGIFDQLSQTYALDVVLEFENNPQAAITYAFRLQPDAGPLKTEAPLKLGNVLRHTPMRVLFELTVEPLPDRKQDFDLLNGSLKFELPAQVSFVEPVEICMNRPVTSSVVLPGAPVPLMVQALSRLALYRVQEQARSNAEAGNNAKASLQLQQLAAGLLKQGERSLAQTVILEAEHLAHTKDLSERGKKAIKYGTRALLMSGLDEKKYG